MKDCQILFLFIQIYLSFIDITQGRCVNDSPPFYQSVDVNAATVCPIAGDCKGWYDAGVRASGVYPVQPDDEDPFQVYCDMDTDGGGWTVLMRRQDGSLDFNRKWAEYESGFGKLNGEFWLGLSKMHRLTPSGQNSLRVDLGDFENSKAYAHYSEFEILDATAEYGIVMKNYTGSAGDALYNYHNLMRFSTSDNDNDLHSSANCAGNHQGGGWWFKQCYHSRLTGGYWEGGTTKTDWDGIIWYQWKGSKYSLKFAEMKTRRN